jgi:hypothetical protein
MTTDYAAGRQRNHLPMTDAEFNLRLGAIEAAFGAGWLASSDAALAGLWRRKDAFAVNQLCLLGDAVAGFNAIDAKWVKEHVDKIKGTDANSRRGSMFELLGANLFRQQPQSIRPTKPNNPGYDAVLTASDGGTADISLKSFGASFHETTFREQAARTEESFRRLLAERQQGGVFFAIASDYPTRADWDALREAIPRLERDRSSAVGLWSAKLGPLPPNFPPYAKKNISYQAFFGAPFHPNENKNLSDKFDTAFANAKKHAVEAPGSVRIVLMRVPEAMSLVACDKWAKDYLANYPASPIDGIYLYQIATIDAPDGTSVIGHAMTISETPRFAKWRNARTPKGPLRINLAVGVGVDPSKVLLANGPMQAEFKEGYHYQRGEFFTAYKVDPNKPTNAWVKNLASGIFQHAAIVHPNGREDVLGGYFPPTKEITLFD